MAQLSRIRPFGKADLRDKIRAHPKRVFLNIVGEGRGLTPPVVQRLPEIAEKGLVEAGADLARIAQRPVLVIAQKQRAKSAALPFGFGKPTDDKFLPGGAFEL